VCEFCHKHGDGKKWYLEAKNYSEDLAEDSKRQQFLIDLYKKEKKVIPRYSNIIKNLSNKPRILQSIFKFFFTRELKKKHFGQIVPWEDLEKIFEITNSIFLLPCLCRRIAVGGDKYYCFGITVSPERLPFTDELVKGYLGGPDGKGLEKLDKKEALKLIRDFENESLVHSIWTFLTPFIGGICNCDRSDCLAMQFNIVYSTKVMFRGEYVVQIDWDKCNGCRNCMRFCQFGALAFSVSQKKVYIDILKCFGCGVCRVGCPEKAIFLKERTSIPEVANLW
jgi:NAD-dependent dihydropyrimidine dehydrogenase PreA subunit